MLLVDQLAAAAFVAGIASIDLGLVSAVVVLHPYIAGTEELVLNTVTVVPQESSQTDTI